MMDYLMENVRYPKEAQDSAVQGRVVVAFIIEKDGAVTNARVVRAVNPLLDAEALRVVEAMPKWIPGRQKGKPVRVKYNLPISFRLK